MMKNSTFNKKKTVHFINKNEWFNPIRGRLYTYTIPFVLLLIFFYMPNWAIAQSWNALSNGSDYSITISWSGLSSNPCDCDNSKTIKPKVNGVQAFSISNNNTSGSKAIAIGPLQSRNYNFYSNYSGNDDVIILGCIDDCSGTQNGNSTLTRSTSGIKPPTNVQASDGTSYNEITITWDKGTNIPNGNIKYKIYRNNTLIHTTSNGNTTSYTDVVQPGSSFTYKVSTYTTGQSSYGFSWGTHESSKRSNTGSTTSMGFSASDGSYYNRVKLSWDDISSFAESIRIERNIVGTTDKEELDILDKNATAYNDPDGIPGYEYTYYMTPISNSYNYGFDSDAGYSKFNGTIKGKILSRFGAGVRDVNVTVKLASGGIPPGGGSNPTTYSSTTDTDGYYEIKNIYYGTEADFIIVPSKTGAVTHEFSPDTLTRTLSINAKTSSGTDFTDNTVYTVAGHISYAIPPGAVPPSPDCGMQGVEILLNGESRGIFTDVNGDWSFAIQDEDNYAFSPKFKHHNFRNSSNDTVSTIYVDGDYLNIDFENVETDILEIIVQGGCNTPLGAATVDITALNCFKLTKLTDANGLLTVPNLPARKYNVTVTALDNINDLNILDQIGYKPLEVNLTVRDTSEVITETITENITPADSLFLPNGDTIFIPADTLYTYSSDTSVTDVIATAPFIYRSPLKIDVDFESAGAEVYQISNTYDPRNTEYYGDNVIVMEQGVPYTINIEIKESLANSDCYIDSGYVTIYDYVSDIESAQRLEIKNGIVTYTITPGIPEIAANDVYRHQKLLFLVPKVGYLDPVPVDYWILVTGAKSDAPSFTTRSPEIPMMIIHDPPGDASYSYIEEGTTFHHFETTETLIGGEGGVWADLLIGAKVLTPFSSNGAGTKIKFEAVAGRDNFDRSVMETTITFNERFSTSDAENITGYGGDVYIGAAVNQEFSLADELTWDADSGKADVQTIPTMAVTDFATTFVYTEGHIKNVLIPTLSKLKNLLLAGNPFPGLSEEDQIQVNNFISDSILWQNVLENNSRNRDENATFVENISFSAGAEISRDFESTSLSGTSYEYNRFINTDLAVGAKIDNESGAWFDSEFGVIARFRYSYVKDSGDDTTFTTNTGYVLADNDIGDFFSVDIKEDNAYSVPAFKLKLGTTSCPHEFGSQPRDRAFITVDQPEVNNVPPDAEAVLTATLINKSESRETREYHVRTISTTNPDGAVIKVGGADITNKPASFFLDYNNPLNVSLTVAKGPIASNYNRIGIQMFPPCEYALWEDNGSMTSSDTLWITVNFDSECSNVALQLPGNNWLVNQANNNILKTAMTGYDLTNDKLESLTFQYKRVGEGWTDNYTVLKEDIIGPFVGYPFDVSNLFDGNYQLRARANCSDGVGSTYSSVQDGIIDRQSVAPFGTPSPSDGFLRKGQDIMIAFDKVIDPVLVSYDPTIHLTVNSSGDTIAINTQLSGKEMILAPLSPLKDRTDLDGDTLTAYVNGIKDLSGNIQEYAAIWSFIANESPVIWTDDSLVTSQTIDTTSITITQSKFAGGLKSSLVTKSVLAENEIIFTLDAGLLNRSSETKAYSLDKNEYPTLVEYPVWLTPLATQGTILPNSEVQIFFNVVPGLEPGIYRGVVTAVIDGFPESMKVTYELLAPSPNWEVVPADYQYSMNIIAQYSLDDQDFNLSTDSRDVIAAVIDGEIRGIGNIEYIPSTNSYLAFITVHSNNNRGDDIGFRIWHARSGVQYGAKETVEFKKDAIVGTNMNPLILHPDGIFQVIPLAAGWNWISFNLLQADMSVNKVFESIVAPKVGNKLLVKSQHRYAEYHTRGHGNDDDDDDDNHRRYWHGSLKSLNVNEGYMLYLSDNPDTLRFVGKIFADSIITNIEGKYKRWKYWRGGWNWVGYPHYTVQDVDFVLSNLENSSNNDLIKGQAGFAQYNESANDWIGDLKYMEPNKAYKLNVRNSGSLVFNKSLKSGAEELQVDPQSFENNMTITATINFKGAIQNYEGLKLAAYAGEELQGLTSFEIDPDEGKLIAYLLVHGQSEDEDRMLTFKVLDENSNKEYVSSETSLIFASDDIVGTYLNPYVLPFDELDENYSGSLLYQNYPNPFGGNTTISYRIQQDERVVLKVYNQMGQLVETLVDTYQGAGRYSVEFTGEGKGSGFYKCVLQTDSFTETIKMLLVK